MSLLNNKILNQFIDIVSVENVENNNATLLAYSYDSTAKYQALPHAVISPRNPNEILDAVKFCNRHQIYIAST